MMASISTKMTSIGPWARKNAGYLLYPIGFALAPVLTFLSHNLGEALLNEAIVAVLLVLSASLVTEIILLAILRDAARSGIVSAVVFFAFFSYGAVAERIPLFRFMLFGVPIGPNKVLYLSMAIVFIPAALFAWRTNRRRLDTSWRILRLMASVLVLSSLATLTYSYATLPRTSNEVSLPDIEGGGTKPQAIAGSGESKKGLSAKKPDIYYIILDGYMGTEGLRQATGYDNTPFIDALKNRGFFVAGNGRSNYWNTDESVLSILNMQYLDQLEAQLKATGHEWDRDYLARNNLVMRRLRRAGYRTVVIRSPYGPLARVKGVDELLDPSSPYVNDLTATLLQTTMLQALSASDPGGIQRKRILRGFKYSEHTTDYPSPKAVFIHLLIPHSPYAFDEHGNMPAKDVVFAASGSDEERRGYASQLQYANKLTLDLLDQMFEETQGQAKIVVVQGDHGPRFGVSKSVPWKSDSSTDQRYAEFFSTLDAFYFSSGRPEALYDSISSVNTFRLVLNEAIGTSYPLLEDRSFGYGLEDNGRPVRMVDVTKRLPVSTGRAPDAKR